MKYDNWYIDGSNKMKELESELWKVDVVLEGGR